MTDGQASRRFATRFLQGRLHERRRDNRRCIDASYNQLHVFLAAIYAVFWKISSFRPTIERADDLCARLRGELAAELGQALRPFVLSDKPPAVANVNVLFGPDGKPLEVAAITKRSIVG